MHVWIRLLLAVTFATLGSATLGASAVQIGTAYLFCPEAKVAPAHRHALESAADDDRFLNSKDGGNAGPP